VYGQGDPAVTMPPVEKSIFLPEHIHQIIFEQSGHFPMLDETSKFNRLLADFLSLSSGDSPRQLQLKEEWKRRVR
jgi:pimeloyl-ACP methyl ester carboxylesterase